LSAVAKPTIGAFERQSGGFREKIAAIVLTLARSPTLLAQQFGVATSGHADHPFHAGWPANSTQW
jgi:hypothetical protein